MTLSLSALRKNAQLLLAQSPAPLRVDPTADAWGHGIDFITEGLGEAVEFSSAGNVNESLLGLTAGFEPVMTLKSVIANTKKLRTGEGVSYGYSYRAAKDSHVALVVGGYAAGVPRAVGNLVSVTIAGAAHPIVGRVAMNVCMVDIGDSEVRHGDSVEFFGAGMPVREWAEATGQSVAEIVAAVGSKVTRKIVE